MTCDTQMTGDNEETGEESHKEVDDDDYFDSRQSP
jgi:hypothetical protein